MERRLSVSLAAIGVVGAVVWIGVAGKRTPPTGQIESAVAELEMAVRETAAGTQARAVTLSQLPRLSWAVATDEATVRDLTTEELAFRPQAGESIEIAQIERVGGRIHRLIMIPVDGLGALTASQPGLHLVTDDEQIRVTSVMKIEPRERAQVVSGLVGVAQRLDLSRVAKRFDALGIAARLQTPRGSAPIGARTPKGRTGAVEIALQSPAADGARLKLQVPQGIAWPHVGGALLLVLASIVSARVLGRRPARTSGHPSAPAALRTSSDMWSDTTDQTDGPTLVGKEAVGLRSSNGMLNSSGSHDLYVSRSGGPLGRTGEQSGVVVGGANSTTLPSSLFLADVGSAGGQAHPPVLPPPDNPWTAEYRRLFKEFVKLRRTCSESTDDLDRDRFIEALHQKRLELMAQNGVVDVKFRLAFDNGKAAVRFKVLDPQTTPAPVREGNG